jgi:putative transposase
VEGASRPPPRCGTATSRRLGHGASEFNCPGSAGAGGEGARPQLAEIIDARFSDMAARYGATYLSAIKCLATDRHGLTACLRFPAEHHHRIRHSNFIERTFGETRRRTKVIGRLPGETSCLTLVWAVLDRASCGWRGMNMTADGLRLLHDLRRSLLEPPPQIGPPVTVGSPPSDHCEPVSAVA